MLSEEQRAGLWLAKLRGLARDHFDRTKGTDHATPWGAALEHDGVWTALIEVSPERSFGQALVLAARHDATSLDLLVGSEASNVARRAQLFDPSPVVWSIAGTDLALAEATEPSAVAAPELRDDLADLLNIPDVDIVVEHGVIMAECRGIEVGRVTGEGEEQRLDVGVGAYDQGAFAVMNPGLTPIEALAEVVAQVLTHRSAGARPHPINRLVRERWVRHELLQNPSLLGLDSLEAVEPTVPREGLKEMSLASAVGTATNGDRVLVGCSVGIDLDAVPHAADLAHMHNADRIVMVMPERDQHALTKAIAARSKCPVSFMAPTEPWPR